MLAQAEPSTAVWLLVVGVAAILSFTVGLFAVRSPRLRRLTPHDAPDPGGDRKLQREPIPLIGGLCLGIVVLAWALIPFLYGAWGSWALLGGFLLALLVGFVDDYRKPRGLPWPLKLAGQFAAAACLVGFSPVPTVWVLWLVVCMNAWNFLDNTDGVAAATGLGVAIPLLLFGPTILLPALLTGILLGFLPLNWPRPRAYLGDAGSHALGFLLGWFSLHLWVTQGAAAAVALHAVPLLDMVLVISVRLRLGIGPWRADRRHLAHRLQRVLPVALVAPVFGIVQATAMCWVLLAL